MEGEFGDQAEPRPETRVYVCVCVHARVRYRRSITSDAMRQQMADGGGGEDGDPGGRVSETKRGQGGGVKVKGKVEVKGENSEMTVNKTDGRPIPSGLRLRRRSDQKEMAVKVGQSR